MKTQLLAGLAGIVAVAAAFGTASMTTHAQDPVPVTGPFVPNYTQIPVYGFPVSPVGGGAVMPGYNMPGQPLVYGYPPIGYPGQAIVPAPQMIPIAYQAMPMALPMPLPEGPAVEKKGKQAAKKNTKKEEKEDNSPPQHFGPSYTIDQTNYLFRRATKSDLPEPTFGPR